MKANELLLCLSARRQGSWQQFRTIVEQLHLDEETAGWKVVDDSEDKGGLPLYQHLRLNLERLAHVEFFVQGAQGGWRVAPPVLSISRRGTGWLGILCGARSAALLNRLKAEAEGAAKVTWQSQVSGPDVIRLEAETRTDLESVADSSGLLSQIDSPLSILSVIPAVDDGRMFVERDLPLGADWHIQRFSPRELSWKTVAREDVLKASRALFRFQLRYMYAHFLAMRGRTLEVLNGQAGKYCMLTKRRIIRYDMPGEDLVIPAACRPPLLVERALVLCSGQLPVFLPESGTLAYSNVPRTVAALTAQLLRQEVVW